VREQSIQRLVLIFPGALGDFLLALPALRALRTRHAGALVTAVVNEPLRALAGLAGVADATASLDAADAAGIFGGERLPSWIDGHTIVYSWLGGTDQETRRRLSSVARSVHFLAVERGPGAVHAAVAYARGVGAEAGWQTVCAAARLAPGESAAARHLLAGLRGPVLAIHPGAGSRAKRWDVAGFVQVAEWWRSAGGSVVELAGPAESGEAPVLGGPTVREWPLADLAALLGGVALYVGNDCGVSHLAGAVRAAGVVLFGPTDPERWRPLTDRLVALRMRAGGAAELSLAALPPARVVAACGRRMLS
jgi:ADP-heptose:LPS heptosyltransferase